jgi:hypothetical protein
MAVRAATVFCVLCFALCAEAQAVTQNAQRTTQNTRGQDNLQVFLVTIGEGSAVWEKFGHNSLWFLDEANKVDEAYNWGTFDFTAPGFAWRFVTMETRYWVDMFPDGRRMVDFYIQHDRTVFIQRLNFTPEQARNALAFARNNALEANKYYRYDYFLDNCSTRIRDLIDVATGGVLKAATESVTVQRSFRSESVRLTDDLGLAQFGITAALGAPADKPISLWEDAFVPMRLRDMLRDVRVTINGKQEPLVAEEREFYTTKYQTEREDVPAIWLVPLIIGLIIAVDFIAVGLIGERHRAVDVAFRSEVAVWAVASGILGAAILFAWLFTKHTFWAANQNLLVMNPLSVWLAPLALMSLKNPRWLRPAAITAVLVALCSGLALVLHGIPGLSQDNAAVLALAVPANLAMAFGLWRRTVTTDK